MLENNSDNIDEVDRVMMRVGDRTTTPLTFYQHHIFFYFTCNPIKERDLNSIPIDSDVKHTDITGQRVFCNSGWE